MHRGLRQLRRQSAIGRDLEPNSEDFHFCFRDRGEGAPQRYVFNPEADRHRDLRDADLARCQ